MTRNRASAKAAGSRFERSVADYLALVLDDDRIDRRVKTGAKDRGDIAGLRHRGRRLVIEVKDVTRVDLSGWVREAHIEAGNDDALAASVSAVQAGQEHIAIEETRQGVRLGRLEDIGTRLTDVDLDLNDRRTELESSDMTEVIASVKAKLIQLEAAQTAFARINQQTLFDLIR